MAKESQRDHSSGKLAGSPAPPKQPGPDNVAPAADHGTQVPASETAVVAEVVARTVRDILNLLETPCQVQVEQTAHGFTVAVSPQTRPSLLTGRGSAVLRSIEQIAWMVARRHYPNIPPVYIEIAGQRKFREDFLRKKAVAVARIVGETGREMAIDMLSGPEQAVVRDALKYIPGVRIRVVGSGLRRTVVVVPTSSGGTPRPASPPSPPSG